MWLTLIPPVWSRDAATWGFYHSPGVTNTPSFII